MNKRRGGGAPTTRPTPHPLRPSHGKNLDLGKTVPQRSFRVPEDKAEEINAFLNSLFQMINFGGSNKIAALKDIAGLLSSTSDFDAQQVCRALIAMNALTRFVTLLGETCTTSRILSSDILVSAAQLGHSRKVLECKALLFKVERMLQDDDLEVRGAGAAILAVIPAVPESRTCMTHLLRMLNIVSQSVKQQALNALLQIISNRDCAEHAQEGKTIYMLVEYLETSPYLMVKEGCTAIIARLCRISTQLRARIIGNGAVTKLIEFVVERSSDTMLKEALTALLALCTESRATYLMSQNDMSLKVSEVFWDRSVSASNKRLAITLLETYNSLSDSRTPLCKISELKSDQDCRGLSALFSTLHSGFIYQTVRCVSRTWKKCCSLPETWTHVSLKGCQHLNTSMLGVFLRLSSLDETYSIDLSGCRHIDKDGFELLADSITGRLKRVEFEDCERMQDESANRILRSCENSLEHINFAGCAKLTNRTIFSIVAHGNLTIASLILNRCQWLKDDAIILITSSCQNLTNLGVSQCSSLSSEGLRAIGFSKSLRSLDLSLNSALTDEVLTTLVDLVSALSSLDVSGCESVSDEGVSSLRRVRNLTSLDLSGNMTLSDRSLVVLASECPQLVSLKCMMLPNISSKTVQTIATYCSSLEDVDFSYVSLLDDIGLRMLVRRCAGLKVLNLAWCESLTSRGLKYISEFCLSLESLNVSHTSISDNELESIAENCSKLVTFNAVRCENVSFAGALRFIEIASSKSIRRVDFRRNFVQHSSVPINVNQLDAFHSVAVLH